MITEPYVFHVGQWAADYTRNAVYKIAQVDTVSPTGQVRIGSTKYRVNRYGDHIRLDDAGNCTAHFLRPATDAEISLAVDAASAARDLADKRVLQAQSARLALSAIDWREIPDGHVLAVAEVLRLDLPA